MFQQARWLSLSFALHLAAAVILIFLASHYSGKQPKSIMVVLDNPELTAVPLHKVSQTPTVTVTHPAVNDRLRGPKKPAVARQILQPATLHIPSPKPVPEQNRAMVPPVAPVAAIMRPSDNNADTAMNPITKLPALATANEQPAAENDQQRYWKEHFIYIRELITKRLVYPPLARRMNWSGKVVVAFTILEDGSAIEIRVTETSGFPILDNSALETIKKVAPFSKPRQPTKIVVPISFRMMQ